MNEMGNLFSIFTIISVPEYPEMILTLFYLKAW
ncbi:hypothetical protein SAMN05428988_3263 [Chitinophaga sp. YR573]|nr:hypothetical protein SAMN05428988_3263 [Chitinophaga sp. YR573]